MLFFFYFSALPYSCIAPFVLLQQPSSLAGWERLPGIDGDELHLKFLTFHDSSTAGERREGGNTNGSVGLMILQGLCIKFVE